MTRVERKTKDPEHHCLNKECGYRETASDFNVG